MAADCRYTVTIDGVKIPFTENDLKAYLLKGGKKAFDKINTQDLSAENRRKLDNAADAIVNGTTTTQKINDFIDSQRTSKDTKEKLKSYLKERLRQKRKGTYEGLTDSQKLLHDLLEDKYLNGEMSYEQAQDELNYIIDRQENESAKGMMEEVKNIFFKRNQKRQERELKEEAKKEAKNFDDDIKNMDAGLSDNSITVFQSDKRLQEGGSDFLDDFSFLESNDQVTALFELDKFASDVNTILGKFQQQYGKDYLKEMERFIVDNVKGDKSANATISVAIALNNHLDYLLSQDNAPNKAYLQAMKDRNSKLSQTIGRKFSIGLNALRVWNNRETSDYAWTGVVAPDLRQEADEVKQVLGSEISDEDLLLAEQGNQNYFEEEKEKEPEERKAKKAGFITRYRMKKEAKRIQSESAEDLKNKIEEQKKKCK